MNSTKRKGKEEEEEEENSIRAASLFTEALLSL
jgi:hypothetical protein